MPVRLASSPDISPKHFALTRTHENREGHFTGEEIEIIYQGDRSSYADNLFCLGITQAILEQTEDEANLAMVFHTVVAQRLAEDDDGDRGNTPPQAD